jgi:hypothetical protein
MNEFEKYPDLARWIEVLANSRIEGMSLDEWNTFCAAVNGALLMAASGKMPALSRTSHYWVSALND